MFITKRIIDIKLIQCSVSQIILRTTSKIAVNVDETVLNQVENNEIKPRKHPGITKSNSSELPNNIKHALEKAIGDYPIKPLLQDCQKLNRFINARHPPPEQNDLRNRMSSIIDDIEKKMPREKLNELDEDKTEKWRRKRDALIKKRMGQRTYAWKPIAYGKYEALIYAIGRAAQEFAVLSQILRELSIRDSAFQPKSFFDFGSGVGTGMWATSALWKDSIFEYFNVDISKDMNDLSELILRNGNENEQMVLRNVYYRQFLPGVHTKYDLVLSAFSLFELPSAEQRQEIVLNLWRKCDKYLIIVEEGSRKGSELVNEARDLLLTQQETDLVGHVFAPCSHDQRCPRLTNKEDNTPCNFELTYAPLPVGDFKLQRFGCRYSYVILKKGLPTDSTLSWPRLVRPTLVRSKHVICRMCTSEGNLQEVIFTASKHGKTAYQCAKASRWGDRLPISLDKYIETRQTKAQKIIAAQKAASEHNIDSDHTK